MTDHETSGQHDEFANLVKSLGEVGATLEFHERGEYGEMNIETDMKQMRDAFEELVKEALSHAPETVLSEQDYLYILYILNKTHAPRLDELVPGATLCTGEGAFTAYGTESGTAYENIIAQERVSGEFVRFLVFPMPSLDMMLGKGPVDAQMEYELGVEIRNPVLEDELGSHALPYPEMFISITDPSVTFTLRLDSIRDN